MMMIKLYSLFALVAVALASAIIALVRIALGHDASEVVPPNIIIGGISLACMMIIFYTDRRKIERRN